MVVSGPDSDAQLLVLCHGQLWLVPEASAAAWMKKLAGDKT